MPMIYHHRKSLLLRLGMRLCLGVLALPLAIFATAFLSKILPYGFTLAFRVVVISTVLGYICAQLAMLLVKLDRIIVDDNSIKIINCLGMCMNVYHLDGLLMCMQCKDNQIGEHVQLSAGYSDCIYIDDTLHDYKGLIALLANRIQVISYEEFEDHKLRCQNVVDGAGGYKWILLIGFFVFLTVSVSGSWRIAHNQDVTYLELFCVPLMYLLGLFHFICWISAMAKVGWDDTMIYFRHFFKRVYCNIEDIKHIESHWYGVTMHTSEITFTIPSPHNAYKKAFKMLEHRCPEVFANVAS